MSIKTQILDHLFSDFKFYRKRTGVTWYYLMWYLDQGMRYWTRRKPLDNEVILKQEKNGEVEK